MSRPRTYPKANFIRMVNYWQEHTDFEQLEKDKMLTTYFEGMIYFEQYLGKGRDTDLFPEDIEYLLSMRGDKHWNLTELSELHSVKSESMRKKLYKLITRGYVSSYKEKKGTYYRITPFGEKQLIEKILK